MNLDGNVILLALLIGTVGFGLFLYGKKQRRLPQLAGGVVMMAYPYFVTNLVLMGLVAVVVAGSVWLAVRMGA